MLLCYGLNVIYANHVYVYAIAFSRAYTCLKAFQSSSEKTISK